MWLGQEDPAVPPGPADSAIFDSDSTVALLSSSGQPASFAVGSLAVQAADTAIGLRGETLTVGAGASGVLVGSSGPASLDLVGPGTLRGGAGTIAIGVGAAGTLSVDDGARAVDKTINVGYLSQGNLSINNGKVILTSLNVGSVAAAGELDISGQSAYAYAANIRLTGSATVTIANSGQLTARDINIGAAALAPANATAQVLGQGSIKRFFVGFCG
jgi:hypothetical protein